MPMPVIYLNFAHTVSSPGGVSGRRTEYSDSKRLCLALKRELLKIDGSLDVRLLGGRIQNRIMKSEDMLLVFHRGTSLKNEVTFGADILVKSDADAVCQNEAYELLDSICENAGFRYRGVHTYTRYSPFLSFECSVPERAYLLRVGFIDSESDNRLFDSFLDSSVGSLARSIYQNLQGVHRANCD